MAIFSANDSKRLAQAIQKRISRAKSAVENTALREKLSKAIGAENVKTDGANRFIASRDASLFTDGSAAIVCFPHSTQDVVEITRIANAHNAHLVARGAGTGLAGGAIPLGQAVVISFGKMNAIEQIDIENRIAWVQPGVINLDLTNTLAEHGFHFAPDPSSQQVCTIGGNVANNSGGPHCLAYGVTNAHIMAIEVVLPNAEVVLLGGLDAEPAGYDLRGAFVGSEGTCGIATKIAVRLTPNANEVRTSLIAFSTIEDAAETVSAIIAAGIVPAALEVMDKPIVAAVENYASAGFPTEAAAVLLAEVDGTAQSVEIDIAAISEIATKHHASSIRLAASEAERKAIWHGRKTAFGAIAQIEPDYYLHDTVVPRHKLAEVLTQVYEIAERYDLTIMNVFHAGDGNLHPLIVFDARIAGTVERVHKAGGEIVEASLAAGGVLSGEHGIGIEKQGFFELMFSDDDIEHQNRLRRAFDPQCRSNPGKVIPIGHSCADINYLKSVPKQVWV